MDNVQTRQVNYILDAYLNKNYRLVSKISAEKITFLTNRRTDDTNYRVDSLLKHEHIYPCAFRFREILN